MGSYKVNLYAKIFHIQFNKERF